EAKRFASVIHRVKDVRPHPVEYRHEVVRYHLQSTGSHVAQAYLVVLNVLLIVASLLLDVFVYRQTFDHSPRQASGFHLILPFFYFFYLPDLTDGYMVKSCNHACASALTNVGKGDGA